MADQNIFRIVICAVIFLILMVLLWGGDIIEKIFEGHSVKKAFVSGILLILTSIIATPITKPIGEAFEAVIEDIKLAQVKNEKTDSEEPPALPEASTTSVGPVITAQKEQNRLLFHSSLPVANRALVPDDSLYPDIDMESISLLQSGFASIPGYQGGERFLDAVTYPFSASSSKSSELFKELEEEILKNPLVGYMIVLGLQETLPGFAQETLLKEFADACAAAYSLPFDAEDRGIATWYAAYRFPDDETAVYVTDTYRHYAEAICQLLETFTKDGIQELQAVMYYTRSAFAIEYEDVQINRNEGPITHPAFVLHLEDTSGEVICAIGFDLNDKGMYIYSPDMIQE